MIEASDAFGSRWPYKNDPDLIHVPIPSGKVLIDVYLHGEPVIEVRKKQIIYFDEPKPLTHCIEWELEILDANNGFHRGDSRKRAKLQEFFDRLTQNLKPDQVRYNLLLKQQTFKSFCEDTIGPSLPYFAFSQLHFTMWEEGMAIDAMNVYNTRLYYHSVGRYKYRQAKSRKFVDPMYVCSNQPSIDPKARWGANFSSGGHARARRKQAFGTLFKIKYLIIKLKHSFIVINYV